MITWIKALYAPFLIIAVGMALLFTLLGASPADIAGQLVIMFIGYTAVLLAIPLMKLLVQLVERIQDKWFMVL